MVKNIIAVMLVCLLFCTCSSTRTDRFVLEHQEQIDRLESELRSRDRAIDNAVRELESITARSTTMEGTIDDVIELFDEYQRTIERLLHDYRNGTSTLEASSKIHSWLDSSACTENSLHDIRFHFICEGNKIATVAGYTLIGGNYE